MTLKEVWKKLGKPTKFVAVFMDVVICYDLHDVAQMTSDCFSLAQLTLTECHKFAKEAQGGDGFPFNAVNNFDYKRLLKDEHDVVHYTAASSWTYVYMAEGDEELIELDQDGFVTDAEPEEIIPTVKECICPSHDLLKGHVSTCPYSKKEE